MSKIALGYNREATLKYAYTSYLAEMTKDLGPLIARKVEDLRFYDVPGIDQAVAICAWGRSGSWLLASYLDWHDNVLTLPLWLSERIYRFFKEYPFLSLGEKLIAYPDFAHGFFEGTFVINEADYCAAVRALLERFGNESAEFLESRRSFFVFLHVAYNLALGRRPGTPRPLIVYGQHAKNDNLAQHFIEDFPAGRFIHMVRDPISTIDSVFGWHLRRPQPRYCDPALHQFSYLAQSDHPHPRMASRSRAVRFEDLHLNTAETMNHVASWLGLAPTPSLSHSTFNGIEWVVETGDMVPNLGCQAQTARWSGARSEQVRRHSRNMFILDKALVFSLFYENFVRWGYPCPAIFARPWVRVAVAASFCLLPMKMELMAGKEVIRQRAWPALRHGELRYPAGVPIRLLLARIAMRRLFATQVYRRLAGEPPLLTLL